MARNPKEVMEKIIAAVSMDSSFTAESGLAYLVGEGYLLEPDWQPIGTAEKNPNTLICTYDGALYDLACWQVDPRVEQGGFWSSNGIAFEPLLWKPLTRPRMEPKNGNESR
jgi:hypothetical protein